MPVVSQTSSAVTVGAVLVPLLRAAGVSPLTTGAALPLGVLPPGGLAELLQATTALLKNRPIEQLSPQGLHPQRIAGPIVFLKRTREDSS